MTEGMIEQATLSWIESLQYRVLSRVEMDPDETESERNSYTDVIYFRTD